MVNNLSTFFTVLTPDNSSYASNYYVYDGTYFYVSAYGSPANANIAHVAKSTEAITWTSISSTTDTNYFSWGMFYIPSIANKYILLRSGSGGDYQVIVDISTDGVTFTQKDLSSYFSGGRPIEYVSYQNNNKNLCQGYYTNSYSVYTTDFTNFTKLDNILSNKYCYRIVWSPTLLLYVAIDVQNNVIYSTTDLTIAFTQRATCITNMRGLYWFNYYFIFIITMAPFIIQLMG